MSEKIRIQCGRLNLHTVHGDDVYGDRPLTDSQITVLQEWICGMHMWRTDFTQEISAVSLSTYIQQNKSLPTETWDCLPTGVLKLQHITVPCSKLNNANIKARQWIPYWGCSIHLLRFILMLFFSVLEAGIIEEVRFTQGSSSDWD
jgi:hypothetical protein